MLHFQGELTSAYRRLAIEGGFPLYLRRLRLFPRMRYGIGRDLPPQLGFALGGFDGFPGLHLGEDRNSREALAALEVSYPVVGRLRFSVEPVAGLSSGNGAFLPEGRVKWGIRAGLGITTPLGPVRAEYGITEAGRDAVLVRIGRWF